MPPPQPCLLSPGSQGTKGCRSCRRLSKAAHSPHNKPVAHLGLLLPWGHTILLGFHITAKTLSPWMPEAYRLGGGTNFWRAGGQKTFVLRVEEKT